jgi:ABC-type Fe3+-citrate transport system substrate-binding protein
MKRIILTFGFIAFLSLTAASCSTDDSALNDTSADGTIKIDNGDKDLPKPPIRP